MRKFYLLFACAVACIFLVFTSCKQTSTHPEEAVAAHESEEEENEGYDGPAERAALDFFKVKDPALGYAPTDRLANAIDQAASSKQANRVTALLWVERGPNYDSVGPSNGNTRAGNGYTSGRIRGVLVDAADPTGNTVLAGGVAGGLWRCTNFLSAVPNWQAANDYFDNLAVSSICQDPSNPNIMYFATGEATSNADAVYGRGVWKSTNRGVTWTHLPSTANFIRNFKILCDAAGNVYLAARTTSTPASQPNGLMRSKDGGATWTNITPTGLTSNSNCTDIEISSTGKLHASFGYLGTIVNHRYTTDPANVTSGSGWIASTGIRSIASPPSARRMELACVADTLYAVTVSSSDNVDSCYKSVDGGATWTKQNTTAYPAGLGSSQGWYSLTLAINPNNTHEIMAGGLDAYRSTNDGQTVVRTTFWVTSSPYVHADHHFMQWWSVGAESRILIGCDGGVFLSRDNGVNWFDKNRNLAIKQFYSAAIHPAAGSDYLLAGAQDNGSHQLRNAGLSYSIEVTGGDGCFVHINQQDPQIQFTSYVYNQYRRSTNGGATWSQVNLSSSTGMFVNPFDYDDAQNIMYASNAANQFRRWPNANTGTTSSVITTDLGGGQPSAFKVSPYTPNRVFIGGSTGRLIRLDNANIVTDIDVAANVTNIRGAAFSNGFINCVNTGNSDNTLVAVFSNYGVNNVFVTTDGGTNWSAVDGNLPDMPIRWAVFEPGNDDKMVLATEAGIWATEDLNGAATVWVADSGFPTVRTDMLKVRTSDKTIVAGTHGRGLFTAVFPTGPQPEIRFVTTATAVTEESATVAGCRGYRDYTISTGIVNPPAGDATVTYSLLAGNTAVQGVDFDFTTNGNFTTPSNQHVFTSGQIGQKQITLRIYDDAAVESPESFTLTFAVSGSTNAIAGAAKNHAVAITDNDEGPVNPGNVTGTIGINNTNLTQPFRGEFHDARTQIVYLASELKAAGFNAGTINSLAFNVTAKNSTQAYTGYTIKMKNTTTTALTGGTFEAGATTVYGPVNYSTTLGVNTFALTTPFQWDGVSNVLLDICWDNTTATATDNVAGTAGLPRCHFQRGDNLAGCSIASAGFTFSGGARPDITFNMSVSGTAIATAVNSSKTNYLNSNEDIYYYSATGELIARLRNLSGHNYACTQVIIDRAGTGAKQFWNYNTNNYLMDKTFRVVPGTNNATGRYEITLYYTKAEKEGWEAATGQQWNNIMLVKVPSAISNVTPLNAQPDGPGTVQEVVPVRGTFGTGYTLTYTFDNGFSGFGAGIPGRMNTILTLTGNAANNGNVLNWTTSAEIRSSTFKLEKSYDGVNFREIASVPAAGTKLSPSTYTSTDPEKVEYNYYRVRMLHSDGFLIVSDTILIKNDAAVQQMFVLTNPFRNDIRVRFARMPRSAVVMSLFDMSGKLIRKQSFNASNTVFFGVSAFSPVNSGVYLLDAYVDGKHYTAKVLKQ